MEFDYQTFEMDEFYRSLLTAAATFVVGALLSLLASRIIRIVFGRITSRTTTETDDFILQILVGTIKPLGLLISTSVAWKILPIENEINNAVLGIIKLTCLVLIVRVINKIVLRLIQSWALKIDDNSVSTMLRS